MIPIYPNYSNLQQLLNAAEARNQTILSFRSTRAKLRYDSSEAVRTNNDAAGRRKLATKTFLEAFNCDSAAPPKPESASRARKEIYRPESVLYHFVHYSFVTLDMTKTFSELGPELYRRKVEVPELVVDEKQEAVLLHAKTPALDQTKFFSRRCQSSRRMKTDCLIGFPWPHANCATLSSNGSCREISAPSNSDGYRYNCFPIDCIESFWKHRLAQAMEVRQRNQELFR